MAGERKTYTAVPKGRRRTAEKTGFLQQAEDSKENGTQSRRRNAAATNTAKLKADRRDASDRKKAAEERREKQAREKKRKIRERRERNSQESDRKRLLSRSGGVHVTLAAWMTALLTGLGFALISLRTEGTIDRTALFLAAETTLMGLAATLMLPRMTGADSVIMALVNFLCGTGIVVLYTVSPERGMRQVQYYAAGLVMMLAVSILVSHLRHWKGITFLAMVAGIGALILPLLFGKWSYGAKNWVQLPLIGSVQPSEFVKLCVIAALAYSFSAHRTLFQMFPALLFSAACMLLLMLQRDLGTALIYYLSTVALFYIACGNLPLTVLGLGGGVGASVLGYQMFSHVRARVAMWRNPWSDPLDKGYQIIQALLAIGSGGLFGVGLGQGTPEKIPAYYNDFIFAVICEQLGIIFGIVILLSYLLLIARGVFLVTRARRSFDVLLGCGVLAMLGIQTYMIVGGVIKLIPLTGVTMPFLSYGGSSMVSSLMMIGILHGIHARAQDQLEDELLDRQEETET